MVDQEGVIGESGLQETPIDQCDVVDKNGLRRHRELRKKWLSWL
jgi:hypothetical protein